MTAGPDQLDSALEELTRARRHLAPYIERDLQRSRAAAAAQDAAGDSPGRVGLRVNCCVQYDFERVLRAYEAIDAEGRSAIGAGSSSK